MKTIFLKNILLSEYTTYKIGGSAKFFAEIKKEEELAEIWKIYSDSTLGNKKIFILGGGANVLFPDEGYDGLVLKISNSEIKLIEENIIYSEAGTKFTDVIEFAAKHNLSGLEWAAGMPGSFGGAIRGNAGAFGGEIKDVIIEIRSVDISDFKKIIKRKKDENMFNYRRSIFKDKLKNEIILSAEIRLAPGREENIREKMEKNIKYRKEHQPLEWPSAGSVFKNVDISKITEEQKQSWAKVIKTDPIPVVPVAFLISEAGLKGKTLGGAQISEKHPNFFINTGLATATDVKKLIEFTKKTIKEKFGIEIEEEIQIVK